jgi:hypothetical protein
MERSGGETSFFNEEVTVTAEPVWAYAREAGKKPLNRAIIAKSIPIEWNSFPGPSSNLGIAAAPLDA